MGLLGKLPYPRTDNYIDKKKYAKSLKIIVGLSASRSSSLTQHPDKMHIFEHAEKGVVYLQ
jgi:hypothetical protein